MIAAGDFVVGVTASDHMRKALIAAFLMVATSVALSSAGAAQATQSVTTSTLDSVYTAEQARRGAAIMKEECGSCHIQNWFTGTFLASWSGATVGYLYDVISTTMPEDRPGSLGGREYVDVIAYILKLNGLPAGKRILPQVKDELDSIVIQQRTP